MAEPWRPVLLEMLEDARARGFLGPGLVAPHIDHALGFAEGVGEPPHRALDLGSGAGLPGLPLALQWPASRWTLLDASERRSAWLRRAVTGLGLADRVDVQRDRAEVAGRDPAHRGSYDLVVARGFGRPAVTAECGAPFLRLGGVLIVSDPPGGDPDRWPGDGVARLGLVPIEGRRTGFRRLRAGEPCPARFPRRVGIPAKRPLF